MNKFLFLHFLILLFLLSNRCYSQNEYFDYGSITDGIYKNDFFKMEFKIPEGWSVQTKEQMDHLTELGKEIMGGNDALVKGAIKASEINTANLFVAFKYELGSPVDYNAGMALVAENVANFPGIKSGADYLFQSRKLLLRTPLDFKLISEEFDNITISGIEFYKMEVIIDYGDLELTQYYYSALKDRFTINFILTFVNEDEKAELLKSLNSAKFE